MKKLKVSKQKPVIVLRQHSRKHPVPTRLGELIGLVNALPENPVTMKDIDRSAEEKAKAGIKLKDFERGLYIFLEANPDRAATELEVFVNLFMDVMKQLPKPLQDFIGPLNPETSMSLFFRALNDMGNFGREETLAAAENRYVFLLVARDTLHSIAAKWAAGDHPEEIISVNALPHDEISTPLSLRLDGDGRIVEHRSTLLDGLSEALRGVEAARIRRCPICKKIYWAERKNQPACTKRCNNIRRSRIQRGTFDKPQAASWPSSNISSRNKGN